MIIATLSMQTYVARELGTMFGVSLHNLGRSPGKMSIPIRSIFVSIARLSILLIFFQANLLFAQPSLPTKTVLVLFDEHTQLPGLAVLDNSIRSTLNTDASFKFDIYVESMNLSRFHNEGYDKFLSDYYKEKYKDKKIDVVIAALTPSLNFALSYMPEIAPGAPIVFCGVDPHDIAGTKLPENVTGVLVKRDFIGTLAAALKLQPETRHVVFVGGTSNFDKHLIEEASHQLKVFEDKVSIRYLTDQPLVEILNSVAQLPPHTIVLYSTVFRDGAGESFVPHDVVSLVSNSANAPVYGFVDQFLGRGIVGGHLYSVEAHGSKAAESALRILHGVNPKDIPIVEGSDSIDAFDFRQLKRWNIDEQSLPVGSIVQFKQPTFWDEYRWYGFGSIFLLVLQSSLIGLLIYLRYRRREAEAETLRVLGRLKEIVSNVPGIVWESRTLDAANRRAATFVSDYVYKMLGYTPDEWMKDQPGLSFVIDEDREKLNQDVSDVITTGNVKVREFRWKTKDGRIRWAENHIAPIVELENGVVGLRGVTLDITDRKMAEEHAREAEEKDRAILAAIPDLMFLQSDDGVYLDFHAKEPRELLATPESIIGKNMRDILPPSLADKIAESFSRTKENGEPEVLEYSVEIDGKTKWFEARMVRIKKNILSVVRDITSLRRTEFEAQEISGRLITAHEDERARLARELHDDACQNLALLSVQLDLFSESSKNDRNGSGARIKMLSERVSELSEDLRSLSHQLHPARLQHLGLSTAIRGVCNEIAAAHDLKVECFETNVPATLPPATSLNIYRIVQESLQNVVKHSGATEAKVSLQVEDGVMNLKVADNGRGFDPKAAHPQGSLGLISLRERVRLLHGSITIDAAPNSGTRIVAIIPI